VSDDIPLIFAEDLRGARTPIALFLSAASASQMQQYATGGWRVLTSPDFKTGTPFDLTSVPARGLTDQDQGPCALLSCEAPHLRADTASYIQRWQPSVVKINCAFYGVADAAALAPTLRNAGYMVLGAMWRDDNSFALRSVEHIVPLDQIQSPDWDRLNLIGVRDADHAHMILTIARLYCGEERRIGELRVANKIRNDHIAKLEDALIAKQPSDVFKLQRS